MKVLVTGANGFIGRVLYKQSVEKKYNLQTISHSESTKTSFDDELKGIDTIIHLAARVHIMQDTAKDPLAEFRKANVEWSKNLAASAVRAGVKRFIYLSSLHVSGNNSFSGSIQELDVPNPQSPYAQSKLEAEQALQEITRGTSLETVIIRPPLVYGPNVKGNFLSLLNLVNKGIPFLPLGALHNKRSFVGINNLADFIICCIEHPKAANETFLIADGEDITTTQLIKTLMVYMGKKRPLLPIPANLLFAICKLAGKQDAIEKLCAPLQVNIDKAKQLLNWRPVQSLSDGLKETTKWYNTQK